MERHELGYGDYHGCDWILSRGTRSQVEARPVVWNVFREHHERDGPPMSIINTKIIAHPMNWIIILLMLAIAGIFGHLLLSALDQEPASAIAVPAGLPTGYSPNA